MQTEGGEGSAPQTQHSREASHTSLHKQSSAKCILPHFLPLPKKEWLSAKVSSVVKMVVKTNTQKHFQSQLTTVDKNNKHMIQSWSGNA